MVKFFTQSHKYDDPWQIVTLAYFLRYPNPYASHVLACDVISRTITEEGTLRTTRLIKKTGALPKWFPKGFVSRAEAWVVEESEVDPDGRIVTSRTRNLDHIKVMQAQEDVVLRECEDGMTLQKTTVSIVSNFGWGLTKKIEKYGVNKFKSNLERSRQGISVVLSALRESRRRLGLQPMAFGMSGGDHAASSLDPSFYDLQTAFQPTASRVNRMDKGDAPGTIHPPGFPADMHHGESDSRSSDTSTKAGRWIPRWIWRRTTTASTTPSVSRDDPEAST